MNDRRFDDLTRGLAGKTSRRAALKALFGAGIGGALAAVVGSSSAEAAGKKKSCPPGQESCLFKCCPPGKICLFAVCITPECSSNAQCGVCEVCKFGRCLDAHDGTSCPDGTCCDGDCVNLLTDNNNCGRCERRCKNGEVCQDGQCVAPGGCTTSGDCATDTFCCNGTCVAGANACAACGIVCSECQICNNANGSCLNLSGNCPGGICCGGECVPSNDANCGTCGNVCPTGTRCCGETCCPDNNACCTTVCCETIFESCEGTPAVCTAVGG